MGCGLSRAVEPKLIVIFPNINSDKMTAINQNVKSTM